MKYSDFLDLIEIFETEVQKGIFDLVVDENLQYFLLETVSEAKTTVLETYHAFNKNK